MSELAVLRTPNFDLLVMTFDLWPKSNFEEQSSFLVPTAPPRDLNVTDISEKESSITLKQTEASHLNGIFTKFNVDITENRRDGRDVIYQLYVVKSNNEESQSNSSMTRAVAYLDLAGNSTSDQFNVTMDEFRIELSGLLTYTYYNVSISTCTQIGCGMAANATFRTKQSGELLIFSLLSLQMTFQTLLLIILRCKDFYLAVQN